MNYSTDDEHRETLARLREACEYLERLPQVPVTKKIIRKLREHLDAPTQRLVELTRRQLHGVGPYTPAGYPLMEVSVVDDVVTVSLPKALRHSDREWVIMELGNRLMHGAVGLKLSVKTDIPDEPDSGS